MVWMILNDVDLEKGQLPLVIRWAFFHRKNFSHSPSPVWMEFGQCGGDQNMVMLITVRSPFIEFGCIQPSTGDHPKILTGGDPPFWRGDFYCEEEDDRSEDCAFIQAGRPTPIILLGWPNRVHEWVERKTTRDQDTSSTSPPSSSSSHHLQGFTLFCSWCSPEMQKAASVASALVLFFPLSVLIFGLYTRKTG